MIALVIVARLVTLAAPAPEPAEAARLGRCEPSMAERPFEQRPGLRIVVTRFFGANKTSEDFGVSLGWNLEKAIVRYAELQRDNPDLAKAGLVHSELQIRYIPCILNSHTEARSFGAALGAMIVLWGQADAAPGMDTSAAAVGRQIQRAIQAAAPKGASGVVVNIGSGNHVEGAPDRVNITGIKILARSGGRFTTSMTVVRSANLEAESHSRGGLPVDAAGTLNLPSLALERPLALFNTVLAMEAVRRGYYSTAARLFERVQNMPGFLGEKSPEIQRYIGWSYLEDGRRDRGFRALRAALKNCRADPVCEAYSLITLGWAHHQIEEWRPAVDCYTKALTLLRGRDLAYSEATALHNIGGAHAAMGKNDEAIAFYDRALILRRKAGDLAGEAATVHNTAGAHSRLGDRAKALELYGQALELFRKAGDARGEIRALGRVGHIHFVLGDTNKALECYTRTLPLLDKIEDPSQEAHVFSQMGMILSKQGEKRRALEFHDKALMLRRKINDPAGEAAVLSRIGQIHLDLGEWSTALDHYNKALILLRRSGDVHGEIDALLNVGRGYSGRGDKTKALKFYGKALALARRSGDASREATASNNIGVVYDDLGDDSRALEHYNKALALRRKAGDKASEAALHGYAGNILGAQGNHRGAVQHHREAARLYASLGQPDADNVRRSLRSAVKVALAGRVLDAVEPLVQELRSAGFAEDDLRKLEGSLSDLRAQ